MGKKAKSLVVTGLVEIPNHPRSIETYVDLGNRLKSAMGVRPIQAFYYGVKDLWLTQWLERQPPMEPPLKWATADNPAKNTLEYLCVQSQKVEWLAQAANMNQEADVFIWCDYGIFSLPGMNGDYLTSFLDRVVKNKFYLPGCWEKGSFSDDYPCWRFCGSLMIVPRADVGPYANALKALTRIYIRGMKRVVWEVNYMAHLEQQCKIPNLHWYKADHNPTMFTNYAP